MIYVIGPEESAVVKIGHTTNEPSFRLGNLQIGNPEQLVVRWAGKGDEALEKHLHAVFKDYRVRGEWFDLSPLGDPVQAVKNEVREASARLAKGEALLAADRYRAKAVRRHSATTFDEISDVTYWDPEAPPTMRRGRVVFMPVEHHQSWEQRFPAPRKTVTRGIGIETPRPGCIRSWQGKCQRPAGTTCDC